MFNLSSEGKKAKSEREELHAMASHQLHAGAQQEHQTMSSMGTPPPRRVYRSKSANSTHVPTASSPASMSAMSAYAVSGGANGTNTNSHGPLLVASLLQQLQGVLYSYEMVRLMYNDSTRMPM